MTAPTFLVLVGYTTMISGISLLSVPWALIIGGAGMTVFGLVSAKTRSDEAGRTRAGNR